MQKRIGRVAFECFVDLGITVVYATIAGLLIVGIVMSDDGPISMLSTVFYASLLPVSVLVLIGIDLVLRIVGEWRDDLRKRRPSKMVSTGQSLARSH